MLLNYVSGSRYRTMFDFGFAALDILTVNAEDSGEYTIKATNCLGTSTSSAKINVTGKIIYTEMLKVIYFKICV